MARFLAGRLLAAALLVAASAGGAYAHAQLQQAVPAVGGTVRASPTEIRLKFSEAVEAHFSAITLQAEGGATEPLGKPLSRRATTARWLSPSPRHSSPASIR